MAAALAAQDHRGMEAQVDMKDPAEDLEAQAVSEVDMVVAVAFSAAAAVSSVVAKEASALEASPAITYGLSGLQEAGLVALAHPAPRAGLVALADAAALEDRLDGAHKVDMTAKEALLEASVAAAAAMAVLEAAVLAEAADLAVAAVLAVEALDMVAEALADLVTLEVADLAVAVTDMAAEVMADLEA